jgi:hypothetical protein
LVIFRSGKCGGKFAAADVATATAKGNRRSPFGNHDRGIFRGVAGKHRFLIELAQSCRFREPSHAAPRPTVDTPTYRRAQAMTTQSRSIASHLAGPAHGPATAGHGLMAEIAEFWRTFIKAAFDPYHPERHYMRGPGPACSARAPSASGSRINPPARSPASALQQDR